jgi:hypothetical protein
MDDRARLSPLARKRCTLNRILIFARATTPFAVCLHCGHQLCVHQFFSHV